MSEKATQLGKDTRPREPAGIPGAYTEGAVVRSTVNFYKAYGIGRVVKVRANLAKVEFNPSVFMSPPYNSDTRTR